VAVDLPPAPLDEPELPELLELPPPELPLEEALAAAAVLPVRSGPVDEHAAATPQLISASGARRMHSEPERNLAFSMVLLPTSRSVSDGPPCRHERYFEYVSADHEVWRLPRDIEPRSAMTFIWVAEAARLATR
jgi:hypothetical protein